MIGGPDSAEDVDEDTFRLWCGVAGEDGDNCDTKASADCEKTNPRCSSVVVTMRREPEGTSMKSLK